MCICFLVTFSLTLVTLLWSSHVLSKHFFSLRLRVLPVPAVLLHNGAFCNVCVTKLCLLSLVQNNLSDNRFIQLLFLSRLSSVQPHALLHLFSCSSEHTFPVLDSMKCFKIPVSCYCSFKPVTVFSVPFSVSGYPAPLKTPRRWPDKNPPQAPALLVRV